MKPDNEELATLRLLILKSQTESLSDTELAELNRLTQTDAGAKEAAALIDQLSAFSDKSSLDSPLIVKELYEAFSDHSHDGTLAHQSPVTLASQASDHDSIGIGTSSKRWNRYNWLLALLASNILIATLAWSFAKDPTNGPSVAEADVRIAAPQLVSMTACVWRSSDDSIPTVGSSIQPGEELNLIEGIAEIRIGEGTTGEALVRVEGPAGISIGSGGKLALRHGNLTAKSLGTGSGNVIVDCSIGDVLIDGQSSIGLVSNDTVNELHVFSGQALLKPSQSGMSSREVRLVEGEAVRFSSLPEGELRVVMFEASMSRFVSARSSGFDPLNVGEDYAQTILESKPSVYWRFEEVSRDRPYRIVNQGSLPNMDAAIIGEPGWRRYGENQVAELGKLGSSSAFRSTGSWPSEPLDEYTVELWVKPELYHHGEMICVHENVEGEDGRYPHSIILETLAQHWMNDLKNLRPNALRFVHRTPASGVVLEGSALVTAKPYQVRIWQHVAAIKNGDHLSLWLDGQLSAEHTDPSLLNKDMQIVIGQLYVSRGERRFIGQIDEVAIYDRSLSPKELRKHIEAADRSSSSKETKKANPIRPQSTSPPGEDLL